MVNTTLSGASVAPSNDAAAITLSDSAVLDPAPRAIYVGGAGNLKVTMLGGGVVTFSGLAAGTILPIRAKVCWSTGSTATLVLGLY